jgi:hypothetical protein
VSSVIIPNVVKHAVIRTNVMAPTQYNVIFSTGSLPSKFYDINDRKSGPRTRPGKRKWTLTTTTTTMTAATATRKKPRAPPRRRKQNPGVSVIKLFSFVADDEAK